jgi:hypothetical protein
MGGDPLARHPEPDRRRSGAHAEGMSNKAERRPPGRSVPGRDSVRAMVGRGSVQAVGGGALWVALEGKRDPPIR